MIILSMYIILPKLRQEPIPIKISLETIFFLPLSIKGVNKYGIEESGNKSCLRLLS